jgi:three-Cys-motif partner protein
LDALDLCDCPVLTIDDEVLRAVCEMLADARDWRDAVQRFQRGETSAPDLATALTDFYCEQLRTLGYDYVAPLQRLMRNTINAPLYRLILAGKHPRAAEFFQKISRIEYDGQRGLPL